MGSLNHPRQHRGGSPTAIVACMVAIILIVLLCICGTCSALKDPNLTLESVPGIQGPWNDTLSATLFRNDSVKGYFDIWPENETETGFKFIYFCQDGTTNLTLSNFTYSKFEGKLDPRPYFDLGTVNLYEPYYMNWRFWRVNAKQLSYPIYCEYTDIHGLYVHRFWRRTMTKASITGAVTIAILQVAVAGLVTMMWGYKFCTRKHRGVVCKMMKGWFFTLKWGDFFSDWIHLGLLVLVGYCMIEAIGHSDLHRWRPAVMYNAGVIYTYLTLFAIISSLLRQCAYCWLPTNPEHLDHHLAETFRDHHIWRSLNDISDDWRWQRVFGQLGVLILMGTYLSFVDDDSGAGMDNMASILLAAVVVACIWSAGVTAVVGFRSIIHMCAHSKRFISFRNPTPTLPTHELVDLPCTCGHGRNWKCKTIHTH